MSVSKAIHGLPDEILACANEIRLRRNSPLSVTVGNRNILLDSNGKICNINSAIRVSENEISECIYKLTKGSLYTCERFIPQGFIPLEEGGRAGVCGRIGPKGFAEITGINLRIHRSLPKVAENLVAKFKEDGLCGTLVCSPPAMGKTTFLRSVVHLLSKGVGISPLRVGVADERCELSSGITDFGLCDIISGMPKAEAITILTRTMSPQVIICDEIGAEETKSILQAQNTGVCLIASAHCKTPKDLVKRGDMSLLFDFGLFPLSVILDYDQAYRYTIVKTEDLL